MGHYLYLYSKLIHICFGSTDLLNNQLIWCFSLLLFLFTLLVDAYSQLSLSPDDPVYCKLCYNIDNV